MLVNQTSRMLWIQSLWGRSRVLQAHRHVLVYEDNWIGRLSQDHLPKCDHASCVRSRTLESCCRNSPPYLAGHKIRRFLHFLYVRFHFLLSIFRPLSVEGSTIIVEGHDRILDAFLSVWTEGMQRENGTNRIHLQVLDERRTFPCCYLPSWNIPKIWTKQIHEFSVEKYYGFENYLIWMI